MQRASRSGAQGSGKRALFDESRMRSTRSLCRAERHLGLAGPTGTAWRRRGWGSSAPPPWRSVPVRYEHEPRPAPMPGRGTGDGRADAGRTCERCEPFGRRTGGFGRCGLCLLACVPCFGARESCATRCAGWVRDMLLYRGGQATVTRLAPPSPPAPRARVRARAGGWSGGVRLFTPFLCRGQGSCAHFAFCILHTK